MIASLQQWAEERGYRVACGGMAVLQAVRWELQQRRTAGELDSEFASKRLGFFRYERSSDRVAEPLAVIVVAVRRPAHRLGFELGTGRFEVILPPTYVRYSEVFAEVREDLCSRFPQLRGHLETLLAPLKAVACRMGLTQYGRNNITYIPGWGSYFQLLGYVTDAELGISTDWSPEPAQLMPECEGCNICESACPAGAIREDRILLHAESCTTYFSEEAGDLERKLSAQCLFGCLECQQICPVNKGLLRTERALVFDRAETEMILAKGAQEAAALLASVRQKLASLAMNEEPLIGRNLKALIAAARAR